MIIRVCVFICLLMLCSCTEDIQSPKPRAYPKVNYPERGFVEFDKDYCAFSFKYPKYAQVIQDTDFFNEKAKNPCWFNIVFPDFKAQLHFSYSPITKDRNFQKLKSDAFRLAMEHKIKANFIDELPFRKSDNVQGFIFDIEGAVASPFQFYISDEKDHFLRASLYFNSAARPDSIAPIYEFLKTDIMEIVNTFKWKTTN